jgi:CheY-like chemotaxis protein
VSDAAPARPLGVLVVDDNEAVPSLTVLLLAALGADAFRASGAGEALALLRRHGGRIDAALVDYEMPGANGPEVRRLLLEERPGLPCCLMSGTLLPGEAPAEGFDHFLAKPFTLGQLRLALEAMGVLSAA